MVEASAIEARAGFQLLLHHLADLIGIDLDGEVVARVARSATGEDATARLVDACAMLGLRARPVWATPAQVLPHARPDLPIVTDTGEAWLLAGRSAFGRVRVRRLPDPRPPTWERIADVLPDSARLWVFVEPALAAAALGVASKAPEAHASPVRRLWGLLEAERQDVGVIVIYAVAVGVLTLATPLAVQALVNWLAFGALLQPIVILSLLLTLFLLAAAGLRALQRWTVEIVQRRLFVRLVVDVGERLVRARGDAFEGTWGPELVNRFFDVITVQKAVATFLLDGVTAGLTAAVGLMLLAVYHPYLLAFDVVILASMGAISLLGRSAQRTAIEESKAKYAVAGWLQEIARQPHVFKRGGAGLAIDRADQLTRKYLTYRDRHFRVFFRQYLGVQVVQVGVSAALLVICGWLVLEGELTLGQLVAAEFIVTAALGGFAKFAEKLDTLYDLLAAVDKIGHLVDLPQEARDGLVPPTDGPASVGLRKAAWSWGNTALGPLDLALAPGERVAILGCAGSGKSTLADLIAGMRAPRDGDVLRDGHPTTLIRPDHLHDDVIVARTGEIVQTSVGENLTLGRELPDALVWAALRTVGLEQSVAALPGKLDHPLAANGAPLSEGLTRALVVARAILARPRLLIVDGLLDGVPSPDREPLLQALRDPHAPWTLLVFTEDAHLARRLDRQLEIVNGGLVERPTLRRV